MYVCLDSISDANKSVEGIHSDTLFEFIDEIRAKASKKSSLLKKLSDGYLMYNRLYQMGSFEMSTRAKLVINSNSPLSFDDDDEAIRNRILYWKFDKRFSKSPAIPVDNVTVFSAVDNLSACSEVRYLSILCTTCKMFGYISPYPCSQ